ncbi:MAG: hypothetical protein N3B13_05455, partial [Deltaproteobacteria bacterium]|nr:hypothetical protein [Deltaproteobacteria bacterium]
MIRSLAAIICILYIFQGCATEYSRKRIVSDAENYILKGKPDRAYYEFKAALEEHYEDAELHREFIKFALRIHRCDEAEKYYNTSQYREGDRKYLYYYARALLGISCFVADKKQVIGDFEEALRLKPDVLEIRMRYAAVLAEYEMYEKALEQFNLLLIKTGGSSSLYSYIALCSANIGDTEGARRSVRKMLDFDFSAQDLKRANEALNIANSHCLNVPEDIRDEFRKIFDMILTEDKASQARNAVENLILKYPKVPALKLVKALSLALTGEYSSALYELGSVQDMSESCSYSKYASGIIFLGVQKEEKGILMLEQAVELDPMFASVYRILSELYLSKKDYIRAENVQRIYLKLNADDHKTRFFYGRTLLKLGRTDEANAQFQYILDREPENIFG